MAFLYETLHIALAAAPWFVLGLFVAGLIRAFVSTPLVQRYMGGRGIGAIARAAVMGAPLPLCSCGAIPTAVAFYRGGAGKGPATAFLIGTPGIGVDSVAVTYALLGPFMMVARALGAVVTAISTGLLVATTGQRAVEAPAEAPGGACGCGGSDNCGPEGTAMGRLAGPADSHHSTSTRLAEGMHYAFVDLLQDIGLWVIAGLLAAGALLTYVPPEAIATYGSGLGAMLLMSIIGVPLYICATAATPVAAAMLLAGVSPGTALVFLLAGPITSMATLGVLQREMGTAAVTRYFIGILGSTVALGLLIDLLIGAGNINVLVQMGAVHELLPAWVEWSALGLLGLVTLAPLPQQMRQRVTATAG